MTPDRRTGLLLADLERSGLSGSDLDRLVELVGGDGDPYSRSRHDPGHVTGSAFVVAPAFDAIALVLHSKLKIWVQPGGHVEPTDQTVGDGARRELAEEVGLDGGESLGIVDIDIHLFPALGDQPGHLHFDVRYLFLAPTDALVVGDGVSAVRWVPFHEAEGLDESVARPVRRIARMRAGGG